MRRAVSSLKNSSSGRWAISRSKSLAPASACGPPGKQGRRNLADLGVERVRRRDFMDESEFFSALRRADAFGGQEIARGLPRPDGAQHIGAND